jgi:chaperonin GroEL
MPIPKIIHQPHTHNAIQNGVSKIVNAVRPTLGPLPRYLINEKSYSRPEFLDDGGTIARRIIQIDDRNEDVGAMLLRQVLWQVNQQVGDGTATAAVLYEAVYNEGLRYIVAGANPMQLREQLMRALRHLGDVLINQCNPVNDVNSLKSIAYSVCYDEEMADTLAKTFDVVGRYGQIDVRKGHGRGIEHNFVEGAYWKGSVQSKEMLKGTKRNVAELENATILITDLDVKEPGELIGLMKLAMLSQIEKLFIIVRSITEKGLSVVLNERVAEKVKVVVVKIDSHVKDDLIQAQQDIAFLTGATPIIQDAGQTLNDVQLSDFGSARWTWADNNNFGFAGGQGDPPRLLEHVDNLRNAYAKATEDDHKNRVLARLGRLYGGSVTIHIGGITDDDIEMRKTLGERTIRAIRNALEGGVLPGGGTALYSSQQMLIEEAKEQDSLEARAAYEILAQAVEAPMRALLTNAGHHPGAILAQLQDYDSSHGYNLMTNQIANLADDGIVDVAQVQIEALKRAVSGAAQALTVDVMILHRNPETRAEP